MGNHHKVDKSQGFIDEGMTLITETDSDKYLNMAAKRNRNKKKEELYPMPEDRMDRPCGGAGGFDDFVERWTCLLYTSPSPRDQRGSRMPSSA